MNILETYIVPPLEVPIRLSDLRAGTFSLIVSRKAFTKLIKANLVHVNNKISTTATPLLGGETITVFRDQTPSNKPSITLPLEVIFEDQHLAIIHKPPGIEVSGNKKYTIAFNGPARFLVPNGNGIIYFVYLFFLEGSIKLHHRCRCFTLMPLQHDFEAPISRFIKRLRDSKFV